MPQIALEDVEAADLTQIHLPMKASELEKWLSARPQSSPGAAADAGCSCNVLLCRGTQGTLATNGPVEVRLNSLLERRAVDTGQAI